MPMHHYPNKNFSPLIALLAILLICLMTIIGPRYIQPIFNNLSPQTKLLEFEKKFKKVSHPEDTSSLSLKTQYGSFSGDEIGCDFFLGEIRRFEGENEINLSVYQNAKVDYYPIETVILKDGLFPKETSNFFPIPLNNLAEWNLPKVPDNHQLYMIYTFVSDYQGELKLDCLPKE